MHNLSPGSDCLIALDGGTTNTRARLVVNGQVIAESKRPVGVRDRAISASGSPVSEAVHACLDELESAFPDAKQASIVASGMLTSEVGLFTVPHAVVPAGIGELASAAIWAHVPEASDRRILFIPGVRVPPKTGPLGWLHADMMRGEECETIGALELLNTAGNVTFVWPGSHTKLVRVDHQGRIIASHTCLTGEIAITLARQTLIAKSLPETLPDAPDTAAVSLGREVGAQEGIGRAAFLVRIADVLGTMTSHERASFWIGAVLGDEIAHVKRHPILSGTHAVLVGGREPVRSIYADELRHQGRVNVGTLDDQIATIAAATGAVAIAREAQKMRG